jgi:hypothetical protein
LLHKSQTKKTTRSSADKGKPGGQSDLHELEVPAANHECNAVSRQEDPTYIHGFLYLNNIYAPDAETQTHNRQANAHTTLTRW